MITAIIWQTLRYLKTKVNKHAPIRAEIFIKNKTTIICTAIMNANMRSSIAELLINNPNSATFMKNLNLQY